MRLFGRPRIHVLRTTTSEPVVQREISSFCSGDGSSPVRHPLSSPLSDRRLFLMRLYILVACLALGFTACANADQPTEPWKPVPKELRGNWTVSQFDHNGKSIPKTMYPDAFTVSATHFWPADLTRTQAEDQSRIYPVRLSRTDDSRIAVFWFCGVYKLSKDSVDLLLSYRGQGLEGEEAKNWQWPTRSDMDAPTKHTRIRLTRTPDAAILPDTENGG